MKAHAGLEPYPENKTQKQINRTQPLNNNIVASTKYFFCREDSHFVRKDSVNAGGCRAADAVLFEVIGDWPPLPENDQKKH